MQPKRTLNITSRSDSLAKQCSHSTADQQEISGPSAARRSLYAALLIAAIITSLAGWQITSLATRPDFDAAIPSVNHPNVQFLPQSLRSIERRIRPDHHQRIATLVFATISICACCVFTIAVWIARRSRGEAGGNLFLAAMIGAFCGLAGGRLAIIVGDLHEQFSAAADTFSGQLLHLEYRGIMQHIVTWCAIGCGVGFVTGLAFRGDVNVWKPTYAATVGGAAAAALYPLVAGLLFPANHSEALIPDGNLNQLAWVTVTMMMIAAGMCRALSRSVARW